MTASAARGSSADKSKTRNQRDAYGTGTAKRARRTAAEIERLDDDLYRIVREQKPMTVRQVYYQAVRFKLVPKSETKGYRVVQRRLRELRASGTMPYGWIADNIRTVLGYNRWADVGAFGRQVANLYRRDFWARAPVRVEVWIEKDALAGVIVPVVDEWGLDLYVARGYSSISYLEAAAEALRDDGRPAVVYVMTDFDPSGMNVAETVARELLARAPEVDLNVIRLALTREQAAEHDLPMRDVNGRDSRAKDFIRKYGDQCTDLDALPPGVLRGLLSEAIERHADREELARLRRVEQAERESIATAFGSRL